MDNEKFDYLFKIILIGNSGVGKTSIMRRYVDNTYNPTMAATIGVDFKIKTLEIDNFCIKLQIWDTAGQERFKAIVGQYYRGADGIFIAFDLTNRETFLKLDEWVREINMKEIPESTKIFLLGNKSDDAENIKVSDEEIQAFLEQNRISSKNFLKVSALENLNIENGFLRMTRMMIQETKKNVGKPRSKFSFSRPSDRRRGCC